MKKIMCFAILLFVVGCDVGDNTSKSPEEIKKQRDIELRTELANSPVVVVEGCEYFVFQDQNFVCTKWMTHKGNCKNPIHYR